MPFVMLESLTRLSGGLALFHCSYKKKGFLDLDGAALINTIRT